MYIDQDDQRFKDLKDEDIINLAINGDNLAVDYILTKYKELVKIKAKSYFLVGADKEDIIQEGMIGLYKAIRDYQSNKDTSFKVFAELCINRQMITAIKSASRKKHIPLNSYISLNKQINKEESETTYMETIISDKALTPEELLIGKEDKNFIEKHINESLTDLECKVLVLYLQGKNYRKIARIINKPEKSIDNALQRVKRKLEKFLKQKDIVC